MIHRIADCHFERFGKFLNSFSARFISGYIFLGCSACMMTSECVDVPEIEFNSYKQYGNLIMDIFETINENFEYALAYKKGKKDFSTYEIKEVFVLE